MDLNVGQPQLKITRIFIEKGIDLRVFGEIALQEDSHLKYR